MKTKYIVTLPAKTRVAVLVLAANEDEAAKVVLKLAEEDRADTFDA